MYMFHEYFESLVWKLVSVGVVTPIKRCAVGELCDPSFSHSSCRQSLPPLPSSCGSPPSSASSPLLPCLPPSWQAMRNPPPPDNLQILTRPPPPALHSTFSATPLNLTPQKGKIRMGGHHVRLIAR
jgi:hypothetical protein